MKKIFTLVLSVCPAVASADYLDDKIAELTKQKLEKIAELEECQKSTKGLKIAGITTLGVSTIGIAANIGEAVALKKLDKDISTAEASKQDLDTQIQAQKAKNAAEQARIQAEQQAANNTCGVQPCDEAKKSVALSNLNAEDVVCVNGEWQASQCKDGFSDAAATCTLNAQSVTYYTNCVQSQGGDVEEEVASTTKQYKFCSPEETQKIDGAKKSWYNSNGICIAYSCNEGWYLEAKKGKSIGRCIEECSEHQREKWSDRDTIACHSDKENIPECGDSTACGTAADDLKSQMGATEIMCVDSVWRPVKCMDNYMPNNELNKCINSSGNISKYYDSCGVKGYIRFYAYDDSTTAACVVYEDEYTLVKDVDFYDSSTFFIWKDVSDELAKKYGLIGDTYRDFCDRKEEVIVKKGKFYWNGSEISSVTKIEEEWRNDCCNVRFKYKIEYSVVDAVNYSRSGEIISGKKVTVELPSGDNPSVWSSTLDSAREGMKNMLEERGFSNVELVPAS